MREWPNYIGYVKFSVEFESEVRFLFWSRDLAGNSKIANFNFFIITIFDLALWIYNYLLKFFFPKKICTFRKNLSPIGKFFNYKLLRNLHLKKKHIFAILRACACAKKIWRPESDSQGNFLFGPKKTKFFKVKLFLAKKRKKFRPDFEKWPKKLK